MEYKGEDTFTRNMVNTYNKLYDSRLGKDVVVGLTGSENIYVATSEAPPTENSEHKAGFRANQDGGGTLYMNSETGVEVVSHESFHAYQHENGQGGASLFSELDAYLFSTAVSAELSEGGGFFIPSALNAKSEDSELGGKFQSAVRNLLFSQEFSREDFDTAH